eukprot:gb/GFBE01005881.1/.p1 GENE.gb/GFBE01005881.1/~~gb/GFBE01005881.1/.p1  ORF type:complete len:702 (+),score=170.27 gb/GFBE01005881.1/:1-2106(+)
MAPKRAAAAAPGLNSERRKELQELFKSADKDGSNSLSFSEMTAVLREGNPSLTDRELAFLFREIDSDGNLQVDLKEFTRYVNKKGAEAKIQTPKEKDKGRKAKEEFRKMDKDGDGTLSLEEMKLLLRKGNPRMSDEELQLLFASIDDDDSGTLEFDEFVDFITGNNAKEYWALPEVPWSVKVAVPKAYRERACTIPQAERRGITVRQVEDVASMVKEVVQKARIMDDARRVTPDTCNMYHVSEQFVKPLTLRFRCSLVELVAAGPQAPKWFVSHWWGIPICQTVMLLKFHAEQRKAERDASFWIDSLANNQHAMEGIPTQVLMSPFAKVMLSSDCVGTVALVDPDGVGMSRSWCIFEGYLSTEATKEKHQPHVYDVAAWNPATGKAGLLVDCGQGRSVEVVGGSGDAFPLAVYAKGVKTSIQKSESTRPEDKKRILHSLVGTPENQWDKKNPPADSHAYNVVNHDLRIRYAAGAVYAAAADNNVKLFRKLLSEHYDVKDVGVSRGQRPIHVAVKNGHADILAACIQAGSNLNLLLDDGTSALFVAAEAGNEDLLNELLKAKADPNLARQDGWTPLHTSIEGDIITMTGALLDAKAAPDGVMPGVQTPLQLAAQLDKASYCDLLVDYGADVNAKSDGLKAHQMAKRGSKLEVTLAEAAALSARGERVGRRASATDAEVVGAFEQLSRNLEGGQSRKSRSRPE